MEIGVVNSKKMFLKIIFLAFLVKFSEAGSANCTFVAIPPLYACQLIGQDIQSELDLQTIGGVHLPGFTDASVTLLTHILSTVQVFPTQIPTRFTNLEQIHLWNAGMRLFNSRLVNCNWLRSINLSFNQISSIPERIFQICGLLRELDLSYNTINRIHIDAFAGLTYLEKLTLTGNRISTLTPQIFAPMPNIVTLELEANKLQQFNSAILNQLLILRHLNLAGNQLSTWDMNGMERNHDRIERIELAGNHFTTIYVRGFQRFPNLESLSLGSNIANFPHLENIFRLRKLNLSNNPMVELHAENFRNIMSLEELTIENNNITTVNFTLMGNDLYLTQLRVLRLGGNRISNLHDDNFNMLRLTVLDLSNNQITRLNANDLRPIRQLRELNLDDNQISRIERGFFNDVTTKTLRLTNNFCFNGNINIVNDFEDNFAPSFGFCFSIAATTKVNLAVLFVSFLLTLTWNL